MRGDTIQVPGGPQALQRSLHLMVVKGSKSGVVPVPDPLGGLVLEAAAWAGETRDRERHSEDAAFPTRLISDPLAERERFAGSDRGRLLRLDEVLGGPRAEEWRAPGRTAPDAITTWRLLLGG